MTEEWKLLCNDGQVCDGEGQAFGFRGLYGLGKHSFQKLLPKGSMYQYSNCLVDVWVPQSIYCTITWTLISRHGVTGVEQGPPAPTAEHVLMHSPKNLSPKPESRNRKTNRGRSNYWADNNNYLIALRVQVPHNHILS